MKKKFVSLMMVGAMTAALVAGCGSTGGNANSGAANSGAANSQAANSGASTGKVEEVSLTVMTPAEDDAWVRQESAAFEKEHPEYKITWNYLQTSEADAKDVILKDPTAISQCGDVYMFANDQLTSLVKANAIAKLGGSTADAVKADNGEAMVASVTYQNSIYAIPYTSNTWFMFYDKSVFSDSDVKSLDTMLSKGRVAMDITNGWYFPAFYAGNGCTFYGDGTDESAKIDFSGDKAANVTKAIVGLVANKNFVIATPEDSIGQLTDSDASKKISAFMGGSWNTKDVKEKLGDNMGCAALPTVKVDGKDVQMKAFAGSKALGVNPNSKNQKAAVALAAFLGSEKAQLDHFTMRQIPPTNTKVASSADVQKDLACAAQAAVASKTSILQPAFGMDSWWDAATNFAKAIISGEVTDANAAEKTAAFNETINSSIVK